MASLLARAPRRRPVARKRDDAARAETLLYSAVSNVVNGKLFKIPAFSVTLRHSSIRMLRREASKVEWAVIWDRPPAMRTRGRVSKRRDTDILGHSPAVSRVRSGAKPQRTSGR